MTDSPDYSPELESLVHKTIKKVGDDIEKIKFNTAIASLMSLVNEFYKKGSVTRGEYKTLLILLNPFAPHITEELFEMMNFGGTLTECSWPGYDEAKTIDSTVEMAVMIGGRVRAKILVPADMAEEDIKSTALSDETVKAALSGKNVTKVIVVPKKLVNIVAK